MRQYTRGFLLLSTKKFVVTEVLFSMVALRHQLLTYLWITYFTYWLACFLMHG